MATEKKKKTPGHDIKESLAPEIAEPLLRWLITYFSKDFLEKDMDFFNGISLPLNLFVSWILPDESIAGQASSMMIKRFPAVAKEKLTDWENAKEKLYKKRMTKALKEKTGTPPPVTDADYEEFKDFLTFPNRDITRQEIVKKFGDLGRNISEVLKKLEDSEKLQAIIDQTVKASDSLAAKISPVVNDWKNKQAAKMRREINRIKREKGKNKKSKKPFIVINLVILKKFVLFEKTSGKEALDV